jgi:hypothetical protein
MNASAAVSYSSSTPSTVAAASTVYLGPNGLGNAAATDCTWVSNKTGVVREFYAAVNSAPGGTQTFTYTVYKNGIATSMTGTITGSSFSVSTTGNPVAISPGDYLSIQLVTSGTATAAKHRYYLSVE